MVVHPSPGHWHGTLVNALMHKSKYPSFDLNVNASKLYPMTLQSSSLSKIHIYKKCNKFIF